VYRLSSWGGLLMKQRGRKPQITILHHVFLQWISQRSTQRQWCVAFITMFKLVTKVLGRLSRRCCIVWPSFQNMWNLSEKKSKKSLTEKAGQRRALIKCTKSTALSRRHKDCTRSEYVSPPRRLNTLKILIPSQSWCGGSRFATTPSPTAPLFLAEQLSPSHYKRSTWTKKSTRTQSISTPSVSPNLENKRPLEGNSTWWPLALIRSLSAMGSMPALGDTSQHANWSWCLHTWWWIMMWSLRMRARGLRMYGLGRCACRIPKRRSFSGGWLFRYLNGDILSRQYRYFKFLFPSFLSIFVRQSTGWQFEFVDMSLWSQMTSTFCFQAPPLTRASSHLLIPCFLSSWETRRWKKLGRVEDAFEPITNATVNTSFQAHTLASHHPR